MPFDQADPDPQLVEKWFLRNPPVPERTFELGLVLGGTVSAGAYTAGALDFLIEALDCCEEARATDPTVPQHRVLMRVITGTSGGGVNTAIAARALNFEFPHISRDTPVGANGSGNPFYETWIRNLTLDRFLATSDLHGDLASLLNGNTIDDATQWLIEFTGTGPRPNPRPWLATPLRLILTMTNLAGVPYRLFFPNNRSETYVDHADYIRIAVDYPGQAATEYRPDELILGFGAPRGVQAIGWDEFSRFARATSAFPAGFPPRELTRPTEHYRWRIVPRTTFDQQTATGGQLYAALKPDWEALLQSGASSADGHYFFLAVDGGVTDNEPIELAHTALCGILGTNPRGSNEANRAIILIDPFAGKADLGRQTAGRLIDNLGSLFSTVTEQTRYDSRDLLLAADGRVFSRFMLTPHKGSASGGDAIASAGLGAFLGFACADFMRYDYLLGRQNCRDFLAREFVLAEGNPLFGTNRDRKFAAEAPPGFLSIIPLTGSAAEPQFLDEPPVGKLDPDRYYHLIEARYRAILALEVGPTKLRSALGWCAGALTQCFVADKMVRLIKQAIEASALTADPR
jgi:hypothetical protein